MSTDDGSYSCRICLEDANRDEVIAPCACTGTSKWVHRECLDKWRTTREDKAFSKCTECLTEYLLISKVKDSWWSSTYRYIWFYSLIIRDILLVIFFAQIPIFISYGIIAGLDSKSKFLLILCHAKSFPVVSLLL